MSRCMLQALSGNICFADLIIIFVEISETESSWGAAWLPARGQLRRGQARIPLTLRPLMSHTTGKVG